MVVLVFSSYKTKSNSKVIHLSLIKGFFKIKYNICPQLKLQARLLKPQKYNSVTLWIMTTPQNYPNVYFFFILNEIHNSLDLQKVTNTMLMQV